ncbi:hypothetical protein [Streptomyces sp. NPDC091209]|uniref:hypothetical protein n=1 Tax=Streptomyces sp. NPDC091209 TaxID=3365974 RepID=UPI00380850FC
MRDKVPATGQDAFMNAFHGALTLSAILGFIAALVGFTLLSTKDLHAGALSIIPSDVDEDGEVRSDGSPEVAVARGPDAPSPEHRPGGLFPRATGTAHRCPAPSPPAGAGQWPPGSWDETAIVSLRK